MAKTNLNEDVVATASVCQTNLNKSLALHNLTKTVTSKGEDVKLEAWELEALIDMLDMLTDPVDEIWDERSLLGNRVSMTDRDVIMQKVI